MLGVPQKYTLHMHTRRRRLAELPSDEEGVRKWLMEQFADKVRAALSSPAVLIGCPISLLSWISCCASPLASVHRCCCWLSPVFDSRSPDSVLQERSDSRHLSVFQERDLEHFKQHGHFPGTPKVEVFV